jgi:transcriptional regulator with XRE-family HTH domain
MKKFGEKLRLLRQQRGLSQSELGDMLEVTRTHVSRMERGEKIPNVPMLLKISDIFQVREFQDLN